MNDIVERLKTTDPWESPQEAIRVMGEAAAEIERLWRDIGSMLLEREEAKAEAERLRAGMVKMADAMAEQVATIERFRAALEEIVKPGGADDFWQCVDIAGAALAAARPVIRNETLDQAADIADECCNGCATAINYGMPDRYVLPLPEAPQERGDSTENSDE